MIGYIANTDQKWFEFLSAEPSLDEVNFWNPSAHYLFRGPLGSPFLFRLKAPVNMIGGYGLVSYAHRLPIWLAWECFGRGNGAPSPEHMLEQVVRLRERSDIKSEAGDTSLIGCIVLADLHFFPRDRWIPQPVDWSKANLRYARYDLNEGEGARIWSACLQNTGEPSFAIATSAASSDTPRFGAPILVRPRLGQGVFRLAVTDAYQRACAMSAECSLPVLEAAHIRPYGQGGAHDVANGLLLRSDLHKLFDRGYLTVTPDHRIEVSDRLKRDFGSSPSYDGMHGKAVVLPKAPKHRPLADALAWHNENVFAR